jgi:anti-sigma regulatory factor (Ser/Thr protein kinase)
MRDEFRRAIAALPESLATLHAELASFVEGARLAAKTAHAVELVCDELLSNAVRHGVRGRKGADHRIELSITIGARIAVRIEDDLPLFDPTAAAPPRRPLGIAAAPVGGHGLALVRRCARIFRWRAESGHNVVDVEIEREYQAPA